VRASTPQQKKPWLRTELAQFLVRIFSLFTSRPKIKARIMEQNFYATFFLLVNRIDEEE
jgi:hypothetical protein